jgi:group I intron endonuclease
MSHTSGIYAISSLLNKKVYIGYSKNIEKRWTVHKSKLNKGTHVNRHLQSAWNIYDKKSFSFVIIERLSPLLTKQQYEEVETKWVLFYNSHLSEFGYNSTLPGSIPLYRMEENITQRNKELTKYVCIRNNEIVNINGSRSVLELTSISLGKIGDLCNYWKGIGKRKSLNGWIVVREDDYIPEFDYINYKKPKKEFIKKTWRDYYQKPYRKSPEDIIPHSERNLKRVPIIAINISTGEERQYASIKECSSEFMLMKVRKCINAPFGKYKHRGYYFRKA